MFEELDLSHAALFSIRATLKTDKEKLADRQNLSRVNSILMDQDPAFIWHET